MQIVDEWICNLPKADYGDRGICEAQGASRRWEREFS